MPSSEHSAGTPPHVLAIDVGTSSARSLLFDRQGIALHDTEEQIPFEMDTTPDGGASVEPRALFDVVARCLDATLEAASNAGLAIEAVGISCFWHSLLGLNENGEPETPVFLWADTRSAPDVDELRASYDQRAVHQRTGCVIHSSYWPAKLRWLRREFPQAFHAAKRWCAFSDYLLRRVTGTDITTVSMASGTGMLDFRAGAWDTGIAEIVGVKSSTLPRIADDGEHVVGLTEEFTQRWPSLASATWLPGFGDGACANVGVGAVRHDRIALSLGTSGAMRIVSHRRPDAAFIVPEGLWAYRLDHERIALGAAISNGGNVLAWLGDLLQSDFESDDVERARHLAPDGHGLTILPFLAGERSPIWNDRATAVIAGLTLHTGRPELIRAGLEAVGLRFARLYAALRTVAATEHEIVASGGAILRSPAWLQITSDCLDHRLLAPPPTEESSARGAAIMALLAIGAISAPDDVIDTAVGADVIDPSPEAAAVYARALERQTTLEALLFPGGSSWDTALG